MANVIIASHTKGPIIKPYVSIVTGRDFEHKLSVAGVKYESVMVATDSATVVIRVSPETTAYLSLDKDIDWQVSSLQQILARSTIENRRPVYVDMRYNKPIVKF